MSHSIYCHITNKNGLDDYMIGTGSNYEQDGPAEIVATAHSKKYADLIVDLLNKNETHAARKDDDQ